MTTFADYYSIKDFEKVANSESSISHNDRVIFNGAVCGFMSQLVRDGRIVAAPDYGKRDLWVLHLWESILKGEKDCWPGETFIMALANCSASVKHRGTNVEYQWRALVELMDVGNGTHMGIGDEFRIEPEEDGPYGDGIMLT